MKDPRRGPLARLAQGLLSAAATLPSAEPLPDTRFRTLKGVWLRALQIQSRQQRDFDRSLLAALEEVRLSLEAIDSKVEALLGHDALTDDEYTKLEGEFRGPLGARLSHYPALVQRALERAGPGRVVDLGCGRGELLRTLTAEGIECQGVDASPAVVALCRDEGLEVNCGDALATLEAMPDDSISALLSLHMIEHWPVGAVVRLIETAARKVKKGGLLALETPYAIQGVAARDFVLDPTHIRPLHPEFLSFVYGQKGFAKHEIIPLARCEDGVRLKLLDESMATWVADANRNFEALNNALFGFRDFVAIGWR